MLPIQEISASDIQLVNGASPSGDVIFVSTDSYGTPGELRKVVFDQLGLSADLSPDTNELQKEGYFIERSLHERNLSLVYVVTIENEKGVELALKTNLEAALNNISQPNVRNIWLPLMGTGAGRLPLQKSLEATLGALNNVSWLSHNTVRITISTPPHLPEEHFLVLRKIFDEWLSSYRDRLGQNKLTDNSDSINTSIENTIDDAVKALFDYSWNFVPQKKEGYGELSTTVIFFGLSESTRDEAPADLSGAIEAQSFAASVKQLADKNYQKAWNQYFRTKYSSTDFKKLTSTSTSTNWADRLTSNIKQTLNSARVRAKEAKRSKISLDDLITTLMNFSDGRFHEKLEIMRVDVNELLTNYQDRLKKNNYRITPAESGPLTDSIAAKDLLDRESLTRALASLLTQREDTQPFAIGLFGHWGAGKTSQISLLKNKVFEYTQGRADLHISFTEFNAWKNEKADNLGAALAQAVVDGFVAELSFSQRLILALKLASHRHAKTRTAIYKDISRFSLWVAEKNILLFYLLPITIVSIVPVVVLPFSLIHTAWTFPIASLTLSAASVSFIRKNLTDWFKKLSFDKTIAALRMPDYSAHLGLLSNIHSTLKDICAICLGEESLSRENAAKGKYLVVVVDDLDRCTPKTVKDVFDAVRLVADIPRVVTLVAIDERMAFAAVEKHYDQFGYAGRDPAQVARDYLSKILQVSVTLPEATGDHIRNFVENRLFKDEEKEKPTQALVVQPGKESSPSPTPDKTSISSDIHNLGDGKSNIEIKRANSNETATPQDESDKTISLKKIEALPEEKNAFSGLAKVYKFSNPRQLTRLYQAWRLLKASKLSNGYNISEAEQWLGLLFLREWMLQHAAEEREKLTAWLINDAVSDINVSDEIKQKAEQTSNMFEKNAKIVDAVLLPAGIVSVKKAAA